MSRILIVDDDYSIRETVGLLLQERDYEIEHAEDGLQCLEAVRNGFRGLILLDIMMPHLDGWGTIRELVKAKLMEGNVICMLTAVMDPGKKANDLSAFVIDYIKKPFDGDDFLKKVDLYVELVSQPNKDKGDRA